jgi:hypothetical protein
MEKHSVRPPKAGDIAIMIDFAKYLVAKYLGLEMPLLTIRLRAPRLGAPKISIEELPLPPSAAKQ